MSENKSNTGSFLSSCIILLILGCIISSCNRRCANKEMKKKPSLSIKTIQEIRASAKVAPNDLKEAECWDRLEEYITNSRVVNWRGKITSISSDGEFKIDSNTVTFYFTPNEKLYNQIGNWKKGTVVAFSGNVYSQYWVSYEIEITSIAVDTVYYQEKKSKEIKVQKEADRRYRLNKIKWQRYRARKEEERLDAVRDIRDFDKTGRSISEFSEWLRETGRN